MPQSRTDNNSHFTHALQHIIEAQGSTELLIKGLEQVCENATEEKKAVRDAIHYLKSNVVEMRSIQSHLRTAVEPIRELSRLPEDMGDLGAKPNEPVIRPGIPEEGRDLSAPATDDVGDTK